MKLTYIIRKLQGRPLVLSLGASGILLAASGMTYAQQQEQQTQEQIPQEIAQQEGTDIVVEQQQPQVQVERAPLEVIAEQKEMDVQVETGEPEVSIQQPEPEVMVQQQEPEIQIRQSEPEVVVESAEPQVEVRQAEPQVQVRSADPIVRVITVDEQGQEQVSEIEAQPMQNQRSQQAQAQQRQTQQPQQQQQMAQDLMQVNVTELGQKTVVTSQGEELGSVEDIVIQPDQGQAGLVVSTGGILGIGAEQILVPADETMMQGDQIVWQTQQSPDQLAEQSKYNEQGYVSVAEAEGTLGDARNEAMQRAQR